jgi:hypothetical protein
VEVKPSEIQYSLPPLLSSVSPQTKHASHLYKNYDHHVPCPSHRDRRPCSDIRTNDRNTPQTDDHHEPSLRASAINRLPAPPICPTSESAVGSCSRSVVTTIVGEGEGAVTGVGAGLTDPVLIVAAVAAAIIFLALIPPADCVALRESVAIESFPWSLYFPRI